MIGPRFTQPMEKKTNGPKVEGNHNFLHLEVNGPGILLIYCQSTIFLSDGNVLGLLLFFLFSVMFMFTCKHKHKQMLLPKATNIIKNYIFKKSTAHYNLQCHFFFFLNKNHSLIQGSNLWVGIEMALISLGKTECERQIMIMLHTHRKVH